MGLCPVSSNVHIPDGQRLLDLPYPKAIENPAPSFISTAIRPPDQIIQPYEFGDDASKGTGLWLDRVPPLEGTKRIPGRLINGRERWSNQTDSGQNRLSPGKSRWLERSKTFPGIAAATGDQWGRYLVSVNRNPNLPLDPQNQLVQLN